VRKSHARKAFEGHSSNWLNHLHCGRAECARSLPTHAHSRRASSASDRFSIVARSASILPALCSCSRWPFSSAACALTIALSRRSLGLELPRLEERALLCLMFTRW